METRGRSWLPLSIFLLFHSMFTISLSTTTHRHLLQAAPSPPNSSTPASYNGKLVTAVIATAAASFAVSGLLFFFIHRFLTKRLRSESQIFVTNPMPPFHHNKVDPNPKGIVVDDCIWNSFDGAAPKRCKYCNSLLKGCRDEEDDLPPGEKGRRRLHNEDRGSQEIPLLPSNSINSSSMVFEAEKVVPAAPPPPPPAPPPLPPVKKTPAPPPPPPTKQGPSPPPPPKGKRAGGPPALPGSSRPPAVPDSVKNRPRMKPLHWDKVTPANAGQSMVWDKITDGSIKFDDDLIETLFGYGATNQARRPSHATFGAASLTAPVPAQIRLLDPRKSQNIAIILRTLAVSRREIIDGLLEGHGIARDALEKLSRISPTPDEETLILSYSGDPTLLADAESFLFHILRAVPYAFYRVKALHFRRSVYDPEILHLKDSLQTLDLACKELRTRDLFLKLLEATLKAGNRMNAGTARGNAQAFDLTALCKLSDVKSTDGKTSLLHFVVQEVVRSEGKRCAAINRTKSIRQLGSSVEPEALQRAKEERDREYIMLGLPMVGGLSVQFTNVKKAAGIDHDTLAGACSMLEARVSEIQKMAGSWNDEDGGFVREMAEFVEAAGGEIEEMKEQQGKVMEKVRRTTEYYQPGASKDKAAQSLQLFVIVKDFLAMVDQACVDITRDLQKRKPAALPPAEDAAADGLTATKVAASPSRLVERTTAKFPNLPARFMSSDSDEEDDF